MSPQAAQSRRHAVWRSVWPTLAGLGLLCVSPAGAQLGIPAVEEPAADDEVGRLVLALSADAPEERVAAAKELGQRKDMRALKPLCLTVRDSNREVRKAAAQALGEMGDAQAVRSLREFFYYHGSPPYVREMYVGARALGAIGGPRAAEAVLTALERETHVLHGIVEDGLRAVSADALGRMGSDAVPALAQALSTDSVAVRICAGVALGRIAGEKTDDGVNAAAGAVPALIEALSDTEADVRVVCARALGAIGAAEACGPLVARVAHDNSHHFRHDAATALLKIGPAAAPELIRALGSDNPRQQVWAAQVLADLKDPSAIQPLLKLLSAQRSELRAAAASALGQLGDEQAVAALVKALADEDPWVRSRAALALGTLGRAAGEVSALLKDDDWVVRAAAADALGQIGDGETAPQLLAALGDDHARARAAAALAVGQLRHAAAVGPLGKLLSAEDEQVASAAAEALGQIGGEEALKALQAAMAGQGDVCEAAAKGYGKAAALLPEAQARQIADTLLQTAQKSDVVRERHLVSVALGALGEPAIPAALQAMEHEDPAIQTLGVVALGRMDCGAAVTALLSLGERQLDNPLRELVQDALRRTATDHIDELLEALKTPRPPVRRAARAHLRRLRDDDLVARHIQELEDPSADYRREIAALLRQGTEPETLEPFIRALSDPDEQVRIHAAHALGQLKNESAIEPLAKLLPDAEGQVRWAVLCALGELGDSRIVEELCGIAKNHPSAEVREDAVGLLGKCGDEQIMDVLIAATEQPETRAAALYSLGGVGGEKALSFLFEKLKDEEDRQFQVIVAGLGESGDPRAGDWLVDHCLADRGRARQQGTIEYALGRLGEAGLEAAIRLLNDRELENLTVAAESMSKIGGRQADQALIGTLPFGEEPLLDVLVDHVTKTGANVPIQRVCDLALHFPNPQVRRSAARAAGKLAPQQARRMFEQATGSGRGDVVEAAQAALKELETL